MPLGSGRPFGASAGAIAAELEALALDGDGSVVEAPQPRHPDARRPMAESPAATATIERTGSAR